LAIVSFLIAGWLVMLIAEVADNHYVRVFACLCVGLGGYVSYHWIFAVDGPKLMELPDGAASMGLMRMGFFGAMSVAALLFLILVGRLVVDKLNFGRPAFLPSPSSIPAAPSAITPNAGSSPQGLPPIPIDSSPLAVISPQASGPLTAAAEVRAPAPVKRMCGIGGIFLGKAFTLDPGEYSIGRSDADILLGEDNQVSRSHAVIKVDPSGFAELSDLGSTNGTFLNNLRVSAAKLAPGDVIRLGTSLFKVEG
jgi:hypothetical protein